VATWREKEKEVKRKQKKCEKHWKSGENRKLNSSDPKKLHGDENVVARKKGGKKAEGFQPNKLANTWDSVTNFKDVKTNGGMKRNRDYNKSYAPQY